MVERSPIALGLGRIVSGLFVLTTGEGDQSTGMLTSFVQQAGFDPPAVTVAVGKSRPIVGLVRDSRRFCLSVIHDDSITLLRHFVRGFDLGEPAFVGVATATAANGIVYLTDAHAHVACELLGEAAWTDHVVFCGKVVGGGRIDEDQPLTHVRKDGLHY